jgi:hypothetical protein
LFNNTDLVIVISGLILLSLNLARILITINIIAKKVRIITRARSYKKLKTGGRFYFASLMMSFAKKYKNGGVTWKHVSLF